MENNHKDDTKMRIISFIIGVLVGAIISTGAFIISVNVLGANHYRCASWRNYFNWRIHY